MTALDIRNNLVMIDIACNDPDNGNFAGRAEMIEIGDQLLELTAIRHPPRFVELVGKIRLAGKVWPTHGDKAWIGNWCWNGYWLAIPTAVAFLKWLHGRKLFHCDCGEERAYNTWNSDRPWTDNDTEFFDRILGKPSMHRSVLS